MAADASEALGAPQLAGSFVSPKGLTKQLTAGAAGTVVGGAAGSMAAHMATGGLQWDGAPDFGRVGYVAVTAEEIAIVKGKSGLMKPKVGSEVIARAPRSEIAAVELDPGALKAALKVRFADGGHWEFEVPKIYRKTAQQVVRALGGAA
jgi:hypothetical protein